MLVAVIFSGPERAKTVKVCMLAADKRTDELRTGGGIMGIETIKWGLVASVIWIGIYQVFTLISGTPLF
jgi:hypothetical protein